MVLSVHRTLVAAASLCTVASAVELEHLVDLEQRRDSDAQFVEQALESAHNLVTGVDKDGKEVHGNCYPHFLSLGAGAKDCKMDQKAV